MERLTVKQLDGTYHIYDINVIRETNCCDENNKNCFSLYEGKAIDKLGAYEDAEEQGLLIWLPCKVGDTVYMIVGDIGEDGKVTNIIVDTDVIQRISIRKNTKVFTGEYSASYESDFGKTVFLTKEEAEKALERMSENA